LANRIERDGRRKRRKGEKEKRRKGSENFLKKLQRKEANL